MSNSVRNRIFGKTVWKGQTVNRLFCNVSRIVIDPRYRGAGIAGDFLAAVVANAPTRYVELVTSMGTSTLFWKHAGFMDFGLTWKDKAYKREVYGKDGQEATSSRVKAQSKASSMHYYLADREKLKRELDLTVIETVPS